MRTSCFLWIISLALFNFNWAAENAPRKALSVEKTFHLYVKAVQNSDLEGLIGTVIEKKNLLEATSPVDGDMLLVLKKVPEY